MNSERRSETLNCFRMSGQLSEQTLNVPSTLRVSVGQDFRFGKVDPARGGFSGRKTTRSPIFREVGMASGQREDRAPRVARERGAIQRR